MKRVIFNASESWEKPNCRLDQEAKSNNNKHQDGKCRRGVVGTTSSGKLGESIGQWVSFGEGRFDSTTRFLARSLEIARERSGRSP